MRRKILLIALTTLMTISSVTTVFASVNNQIADNKQDSFIEVLNRSGYEIERLDTNTGNEEYNVNEPSKEVQSHIIVNEKGNGDVEYIITEGNLENCLKIDASGNIFLDDEAVMVTDEGDGIMSTYQLSLSNDLNNDTIARAAHKNYCTLDCPYGSAKDYTTQHQTNKKVISLGSKVIENVTATVASGLVAIALGVSEVGSIFAGAGFASIYTAINAKNPRGSAFSFEDKITVHKDKGARIGTGKNAYYHVLTYYANDDYTAVIKPVQKFFNIIEF